MIFNKESQGVDWIFRYRNEALAKLEECPLDVLIGNTFGSILSRSSDFRASRSAFVIPFGFRLGLCVIPMAVITRYTVASPGITESGYLRSRALCIRSRLFTSDGSQRKKLPPHSERLSPPEAACFPCSAALPRFAADGSPPPGSLRFRGFAPQCPGRRSLPPEPIRTAFRTVPSVPRWLALLCFQRQLYRLLLVASVVFLCF